jgi:SAM-dependent methyltransferase
MHRLSYSEICAETTGSFNTLDAERIGFLRKENAQWNHGHGPRNYYVAEAILEYVNRLGIRHLDVLNLSGTNEGKPDPVLYDLLKRQFSMGTLSWTIVDHPRSLTFSDPHIRNWMAARSISCIAHDHRDGDAVIPQATADVVLCTEIVEHLDYSVAIRLLRLCRRSMKPGGLLILTTPNAVYLGYRVLFALGQWDFLHHNDDPAHVDAGVVGHTIYYDGRRLTRLLRALEFVDVRASTFNSGHGPGEFRNALTRTAAITLRMLSHVVPRSAQVLLVTAERPAWSRKAAGGLCTKSAASGGEPEPPS